MKVGKYLMLLLQQVATLLILLMATLMVLVKRLSGILSPQIENVSYLLLNTRFL